MAEEVEFILNGLSLNLDEDGAKLKWVDIPEWWHGAGSTGNVTQNVYGSGGWADQAFDVSKRLVPRGTAKARDRPQLRGLLERLLGAIPRTELRPLVGIEDGLVRHMMVRTDQAPSRPEWQSDQLALWDMQLVAPDPRKFSGDGVAGFSYSAAAGLPSALGGLQLLTSVVTRKNLVTNPSVEVDTTGHAASAGTGGVGSGARSTATAGYSGNAFYRYTWSTGTTAPSGFLEYQGLMVGTPITAGLTYTFSVYVRPSKTQTMRAAITWRDSASGFLSTSNGPSVVCTANQWTQLTVTAVAPASAARAALQSFMVSGVNWAAGDTWDWDALLMEQSSVVGTYFDGSTPTDGGHKYAWDATANASTSTESTVDGVQVPFQIGATVVNNTVTIHNAGDATPPVKIILSGPVTSPTVRTADGQAMSFDISLTAGQTLEIDLDAKTVKINGTTNRRNTMSGSWIIAAAGTVLLFDAASYDPTALMTVQWSDAWI